ncbi:site-specific integrase [Yinghuangia sp. ASG 101]|uniref:tyrosine-type recombinase/integrase n=1 Tax=Yinghuangia sp. ASG 101 TaxID=2896848 RepID=UPI001E656CDE|nr:site-specific integrase [Yinghuangia sp. ASG 101]UGQ15136.1 site-specific integrase [Yinghuangia sp. ASG 101]
MARKRKQNRRTFGAIRRLPSGKYQARYTGPDGLRYSAPEPFETLTDADDWLAARQTEINQKSWRDPDAGAVNFETYALLWVEERELAATTEELYGRLLRLHILPTFGALDLDEITPPRVRAWHAERRKATGATTVAKSYRLLKGILQTAFEEDELIRRNPCRIKNGGRESAPERSIATVAQVDALANAMGPRWRLLVYFAAYATLRPEEQAELRREDVDTEARTLSITQASPELTTGRRVTGDTKSAAGRRKVVYPAFLDLEVKRHLDWFAEKEPDGLLFVGEKGAPFRRSTFGRKWRKARTKVGLSDNFHFYDLRHTGNTLAAQSGATLKELMVRAGHSTERAAMIYQHSTDERQREIADGLDAKVRRDRGKGTGPADGHAKGTPRARDA